LNGGDVNLLSDEGGDRLLDGFSLEGGDGLFDVFSSEGGDGLFNNFTTESVDGLSDNLGVVDEFFLSIDISFGFEDGEVAGSLLLDIAVDEAGTGDGGGVNVGIVNLGTNIGATDLRGNDGGSSNLGGDNDGGGYLRSNNGSTNEGSVGRKSTDNRSSVDGSSDGGSTNLGDNNGGSNLRGQDALANNSGVASSSGKRAGGVALSFTLLLTNNLLDNLEFNFVAALFGDLVGAVNVFNVRNVDFTLDVFSDGDLDGALNHGGDGDLNFTVNQGGDGFLDVLLDKNLDGFLNSLLDSFSDNMFIGALDGLLLLFLNNLVDLLGNLGGFVLDSVGGDLTFLGLLDQGGDGFLDLSGYALNDGFLDVVGNSALNGDEFSDGNHFSDGNFLVLDFVGWDGVFVGLNENFLDSLFYLASTELGLGVDGGSGKGFLGNIVSDLAGNEFSNGTDVGETS